MSQNTQTVTSTFDVVGTGHYLPARHCQTLILYNDSTTIVEVRDPFTGLFSTIYSYGNVVLTDVQADNLVFSTPQTPVQPVNMRYDMTILLPPSPQWTPLIGVTTNVTNANDSNLAPPEVAPPKVERKDIEPCYRCGGTWSHAADCPALNERRLSA